MGMGARVDKKLLPQGTSDGGGSGPIPVGAAGLCYCCRRCPSSGPRCWWKLQSWEAGHMSAPRMEKLQLPSWCPVGSPASPKRGWSSGEGTPGTTLLVHKALSCWWGGVWGHCCPQHLGPPFAAPDEPLGLQGVKGPRFQAGNEYRGRFGHHRGGLP